MYKYLHIKQVFLKAFATSILFILVYLFYSNEWVRENIEDAAFDIVSQFSIKSTTAETNSSNILIFGIDDIYMKEHSLYNSENKSNYGYMFPREYVAQFIEDLDEFVAEIEHQNNPKALFIDYDMSFTSLPYGKELSSGDKKLLEVLKIPRKYTILLPKTNSYNFLEKSNDPELKVAIANKQIVFVSVSFLKSRDNTIRRYQGYKQFKEENVSQSYIGVGIALWQLLHNNSIDFHKMKQIFFKDDIVGNRIWIKAYKNFYLEDGCSIQPSYWNKLTKYSANCSFFDIPEEDFASSILILGGTHTQNDDNFNIYNILNAESFSGVDLHANTLMTILNLNAPMQRLSLLNSLIIIFLTLFLTALFIPWIFSKLKIDNSRREVFFTVLLDTIILIVLSIYLLREEHLWFNWLVPWTALGLVEFFTMISNWIPKNIIKWIKNE